MVVERESFLRRAGPHGTHALLICGALAWFTLGAYLLWLHATDKPPRPGRPSAGLLLLVLAAIQFRLATGDASRHAASHFARLFFWEALGVGMAVSYGAALATVSTDAAPHVFLALAAACWTTLVAPCSHHRLIHETWRSWSETRAVRGALHGAAGVVLALTAAEGGLRLHALLTDDALNRASAVREMAFTPGAELRGKTVNRQGYWDDEFDPSPRGGRFRVAVLGDEAILSGTAATNCLTLIEQRSPHVEMLHFGLPGAGPRTFAAQFASDVAPLGPDLVLVFVSLCDDAAPCAAPPGWFDWRGLRLLRMCVSDPAKKGDARMRENGKERASDARRRYEAAALARLEVCRCPIDERHRDSWSEVFSDLDALVDACRRHETPLALVLAPDDLQVSPVLCESLRRRAGLAAEQLDADLPRRRLLDYAQSRGAPVVDLSAAFRAARAAPFRRQRREWSDEGNAIAAEVVGGWLEARSAASVAQVNTLRR